MSEAVPDFKVVDMKDDIRILSARSKNKELVEALTRLPNDKCIVLPVLGRNRSAVSSYIGSLRNSFTKLTGRPRMCVGYAIKNGQIYLFIREGK